MRAQRNPESAVRDVLSTTALKKNGKKQRANGFSLAEALLSLAVSSLVCLLLVMILSSSLRFWRASDQRQIQIAVLQLRSLAAEVSDLYVQDEVLVLDASDPSVISFHNRRLVKKPGYEILMEDIDDALFFQDGRSVWLQIERKGETKTWQIH